MINDAEGSEAESPGDIFSCSTNRDGEVFPPKCLIMSERQNKLTVDDLPSEDANMP